MLESVRKAMEAVAEKYAGIIHSFRFPGNAKIQVSIHRGCSVDVSDKTE